MQRYNKCVNCCREAGTNAEDETFVLNPPDVHIHKASRSYYNNISNSHLLQYVYAILFFNDLTKK